MESLDSSFEELRRRLADGVGLRNTGDDPVYYLIFRPDRMLAVKRELKEWNAKLARDGWKVVVFSMGEAVLEILGAHDLRSFWLVGERDSSLDEVNATLREALLAEGALGSRLSAAMQELQGEKRAVLVITDIEALHPYLRIGAFEQRMQGRVSVPTVILYPGSRSGQFSLRFLGYYPEDGNYRSIHIGN
jgi:bacteriophage exclusion system BrxB-like protein